MSIQKSTALLGRGLLLCRTGAANIRQQQTQRWLTLTVPCSKTFNQAVEEQRAILQKGATFGGSAFSHIPDVENRDWTQIWDTASSYNSFLIPLPVRCGRARQRHPGVAPTAPGNIELMKIPNFFHLTPVAIAKHCKALKPYMSEWPETVSRAVRVTTINYIFAGPSVRHPDSRFVKLQVDLADLKMDKHGERKFKLLVGDRYNRETGEVTLVVGQCPTRQQNKEYAYYLLTTLYHEACKKESWEAEADNYSEKFIDAEVAKVREQIDPNRYWKPRKTTNQKKPRTPTKKLIQHHRVVGNHVVRFNDQGHPFIMKTGDKCINDLVTDELLNEAKETWKKITRKGVDKDESTFDATFKSSYASEFKYN